MSRVHTVYKGSIKGVVVYIGTTIQDPADRFRWHKANGKDLDFEVLSEHATPEAMLAEEARLIALHKPRLNKRLKQNFNVKLSPAELQGRVGVQGWCQKCLKRRVNAGYTLCKWCSK